MNQTKKPETNTVPKDDVQTDMRHVYSQKLQEELLRTVERHGKKLDVPTIIQCLGLTVAFMATSIQITESQFIEAMGEYVRQVRGIMGLPLAEPDLAEEPKIILPS